MELRKDDNLVIDIDYNNMEFEILKYSDGFLAEVLDLRVDHKYGMNIVLMGYTLCHNFKEYFDIIKQEELWEY